MKGEEKPCQRRSDTLINRLLETHFPALFYTAVPYPPLRGTFPSKGRLTIREYRQLKYGEAAT